MAEPVTLGDIIRAGQRLREHLQPTPLEAAPKLGENAWLKLENANKTHSFKIRGALNAILSLDEAARRKGIIAASSGNHAGAVAYAASLTGASAQILMPLNTPKKKVDNVRRYGAQAILFGDTYDEAEAEALRRVSEGGTWVSPYNDRRGGRWRRNNRRRDSGTDTGCRAGDRTGERRRIDRGRGHGGQRFEAGYRGHRRQCGVCAGYV